MKLTVLICTHNRLELLTRTLQYLDAAHRPEGCQVQVVVAANACSDGTEAFLAHRVRQGKDRSRHLQLSWLRVPQAGKSNALNQAVPTLDTDLIAFVDDDHRVDADYLCQVADAAEQFQDAELFCGRILPDWDGSEPDWVHDKGEYRIYPLPVPRYEQGEQAAFIGLDGPLPGGGNLSIRRSLFDRVGPFATDFGPVGHNLSGGEDLEWVLRALHTGARLVYAPKIVQYHYVDGGRLTLSYLLQKAYARSSSAIHLRETTTAIPLFSYRKAALYLWRCVFCLSWRRRRFHLVRLAAAMGEIKGYYLAARRAA